MSSPRTRITTLNLGSQSIELAEFRPQTEGGLILSGYRTREIFPDSNDGISRRDQVVAALREMLTELQIKGGPVNYTVAEDLTFTRFVTLPHIEKEKIDRIVAFEAEQNVPFPIDQVIWDYQLVANEGEQNQVMLVAIKADLLEEINAAVEETGLRTAVVDLATTALYNAYLYNFGEPDGCSLLIDIGARTTNLLFVEPGKVFTRSVPIGGSSITSAIAKEFNEPFAVAELRKKRDGSVHLTNDGDVARVSQIVRNILTRLHAELTRSISHYCTQQRGKPPQEILLSGGGASTSGVRKFFEERLRVPITFFDPLRKVTVAKSADDSVGTSRHLLGEPVGLALRAMAKCQVGLNLRPPSVVRRQAMEKRRPALVMASVCFVLGLLSWGAYFTGANRVTSHKTEVIEEKVARLKQIELQLTDLRKQLGTLDGVALPLIAAINDRSFWPEALEELNARLPERDIWITELVATSKGVPFDGLDTRGRRDPSAFPKEKSGQGADLVIDGFLLRGLYLFNSRQQEVVVDYFRNLLDSPWFAIDERNQANVLKPTTPNETEWAFPYELRLDLRRPVKLP